MAGPKPTRRWPRFSLRSLILFVALAGSGYGLWHKWEPWVQVYSEWREFFSTPEFEEAYIHESGLRGMLLLDGGVAVYFDPNMRSVEYKVLYDTEWWSRLSLAEKKRYVGAQWVRRIRASEEDAPSLIVLVDDQRTEHSGRVDVFLPPSDAWAMSIIEDYAEDGEGGSAYIGFWVRRRPEQWWGVAWLPEFWLALALGGGLLWSVWKDRKWLRRTEPGPA